MAPALRALLLASDPAVRAAHAAALAREGFRCDALADAAAVEALLAISRYDAAIIEADPADSDGAQVLADLAFRTGRPVLIVLAASADPRLLRGLAELKPDDLFLPPIDAPTVAAVARRMVAERNDAAATSLEPGQPPPVLADADPSVPASGSRPPERVADRRLVDVPHASKSVVAVRLADPARGNALAVRLTDDGLAAVAAETTDELHGLLSRNRVDLVVIENELPGFLSGLDVLEKFHRELLHPEAVLLSDRLPRDAERIETLRPARVLAPASRFDEIAEAVHAVLAQQRDGGLFISAAARRVVAGHPHVRPMPQLLVKLTEYLAMDGAEIPAHELARDVGSDPKSAAELLRVTNGAALGLRRKASGVAEAVSLLGARRTVSLVISSAAVASAKELLRGWSEPLQTWYYRRSVLTAAAAQAFARLHDVTPDTAFLLGLLQDLGIAVLAGTYGQRYAQLVERTRLVPQLRLDQAERSKFGHTHGDVSAALLQRWGLPASFAGPVLAHHGEESSLSKTERSFVRVMRVGEAVADLSDRPCPQRRQALNRLLAGLGPERQAACRDAIAEAVARTVEASRLFSLPEPDPQTLRRLEAEVRSSRDDEPAASADDLCLATAAVRG